MPPLNAFEAHARSVRLAFQRFQLSELFEAYLFAFDIQKGGRICPDHRSDFLCCEAVDMLLVRLSHPSDVSMQSVFRHTEGLLDSLQLLVARGLTFPLL